MTSHAMSPRDSRSGTTPPAVDPQREFAFSDADFKSLAKLAYEQAGIVLAEGKYNLVYGRLSRRLRTLGIDSFAEYRGRLEGPDCEREIEGFINSLSTNHTAFFREAHHFEHLRTHVAIPFAQAARRDARARLRIWSAGCSSGEEAYSIAVVYPDSRRIRRTPLPNGSIRILPNG